MKSRYKMFHIPLDLSVQNGVSSKRSAQAAQFVRAHALLHKGDSVQTLRDTDYEVLDYFYTPRSIEFGSGFGQRLLKQPRSCVFSQSGFAARLLGFSLLVLAR